MQGRMMIRLAKKTKMFGRCDDGVAATAPAQADVPSAAKRCGPICPPCCRIIAIVAMVVAATPDRVDAGALGLDVEPGWAMFSPYDSDHTYRYGPTSIINADGSIDMWMSSNPSSAGGWDSIRYRRSVDHGLSWLPETVALQPTPGANDALSTCDPGVLKSGNYYYLAYTSTLYSNATRNEVYVARSTSPSGGFEKWNGTGWGGNPEAFIEFTGPADQPGAGEPSLVLKDGTIYIYYTWNSVDSSGQTIHETRVSTASASDANWPATVAYRGVAASRSVASDEDSMDVKYVDAYHKFIGLTVSSRFSPDSSIHVWESDDGLTFNSSAYVQENTQDWAHNIGLSGTADGHWDVGQNNFVAYAYSADDTVSWGWWHTSFNPVTVTYVPEPGEPVLLGVMAATLAAWARRRFRRGGETNRGRPNR